jgi:hypothetical protein
MREKTAPARYPCGPVEAGQNMEVIPHIGCANAVLNAFAEVDFGILGSQLSFTGIGYHDKNWADAQTSSSINGWYWGHGRLGDFSIIWFNIIPSIGENFASGYVARGEKILAAQCVGIEVRRLLQHRDTPQATKLRLTWVRRDSL